MTTQTKVNFPFFPLQMWTMEGILNSSEDQDLMEFLDLFANYENYSLDENQLYLEGDVCDLNNSTVFEALFIPTLYSLAFVVGILGNGLLLGVLFQSRKSWSVTDNFILHLAISDVLLLVTLPLWAAQAANEFGWQFGMVLCKITGTVFTVRTLQYEWRLTKDHIICIWLIKKNVLISDQFLLWDFSPSLY